MKCQICKEAEATIHIHEIVNGKQTVIHLCENCANIKGGDIENPINLAQMICNASQALNPKEDPTCPVCGWKLSQFRKMSRLGCPSCWDAFKNILVDGLPSIHRGTTHVGLAPHHATQTTPSAESPSPHPLPKRNEREILKLQAQLKSLIAEENYEDAAHIRDQINQLKSETES